MKETEKQDTNLTKESAILAEMAATSLQDIHQARRDNAVADLLR